MMDDAYIKNNCYPPITGSVTPNRWVCRIPTHNIKSSISSGSAISSRYHPVTLYPRVGKETDNCKSNICGRSVLSALVIPKRNEFRLTVNKVREFLYGHWFYELVRDTCFVSRDDALQGIQVRRVKIWTAAVSWQTNSDLQLTDELRWWTEDGEAGIYKLVQSKCLFMVH
jgi:hypothetical protein